jgi:NADPH:quinone reductase-like Zn-dependent oxidoreductase
VEAFGSHADAEGMRVLAEDIVKGKFRIPISRRYPLAEAAKAHAETEKGGVGGKVLLLT